MTLLSRTVKDIFRNVTSARFKSSFTIPSGYDLKEVCSNMRHGGYQNVYSHVSSVCNCTMKFSVYIPPVAIQGTVSKLPVLYFLPGLRKTVEEYSSRSIYQQYAAEHGLVVVSPDTSPRDTGLPGENDDNIYYGHGAGMYMDAMTPGWKDHYNMFSYVTKELIDVVENSFDFVRPGRRGIMGHSMGGHGSLVCSLKRPDLYLSISCSSPVSNASTNGGEKVASFQNYLGTDEGVWKDWDAAELMKSYKGPPLDFLVMIGSCDHIWHDLKVWQLVMATYGKENINMNLMIKAGHDHSHTFVTSFIEQHIKYHSEILNSN